MKITGYRCLRTFHNWGRPVGDVNGYIDSGFTEFPIVLLETDEGITGVGTGSVHDIDRIFPAIEGEDPRAVSSLYDRMLAHVFKSGHSGATFGGIGALDMAIWDLKAKSAGQPLWRLLGASRSFRHRLRVGARHRSQRRASRDVVQRNGGARIRQRQTQRRPRRRRRHPSPGNHGRRTRGQQPAPGRDARCQRVVEPQASGAVRARDRRALRSHLDRGTAAPLGCRRSRPPESIDQCCGRHRGEPHRFGAVRAALRPSTRSTSCRQAASGESRTSCVWPLPRIPAICRSARSA